MRSVKRKPLSSTLIGARVEFPDWPSDSTPTVDRSYRTAKAHTPGFFGEGIRRRRGAGPGAAGRRFEKVFTLDTPHSPGRRGSLPESGLRLRVADQASSD